MWIELSSVLRPYRVFSTRDIRKLFPDMNLMNLVRWQSKGYITRIRNGWYCFNDTESSENIDWLAANLIYAPSSVSLHSALSYYNLIPEGIYNTTSVSTKKTNQFTTTLGVFTYHHVKPELFGFGQTLADVNADMGRGKVSRKIIMASVEKAILDFFYLYSNYDTEKEIALLRLNESVVNEALNDTFYGYLEKFKNKALDKRISKMKKVCSL